MQMRLGVNVGSSWSECLVGFCEVWNIKKGTHCCIPLLWAVRESLSDRSSGQGTPRFLLDKSLYFRRILLF